MNKLNITIAEPCHEDWGKMQAHTNGRHCAVCEKTVKDFTNQSREQIEAYLMQHEGEKICGRFKSSDIQPAKTNITPVKVSRWHSRWMAAVAAVSFLGFGKKAGAEANKAVHDRPDEESKKITPKSGQTIIHGWIRNSQDKKGMAQVEVRIYSGGKEVAYSTSFANGSYFITIPEYTIWDYKVTLEYNAVDFQAQVLKDIPVIKDRVKLDIVMVGFQDLVPLQEEIFIQSYTMGGIGAEYVRGEMMYQKNVAHERTMGAVAITYEIPMLPPTQDTVEEDVAEKATQTEQVFEIKTYPNPSTGMFNIAFNNSESATLLVYDLSGKMILHKKVSSSLEIIDLTDQPNGTYIVLAVDELTGTRKQSKIVKMQ